MNIEFYSILDNFENRKKCFYESNFIDQSTRLLLLTPSKLENTISNEQYPCIILDNPPYGDLIMPGFEITASDNVASAQFVEDSFKISESKIISKIHICDKNKNYWKIKILYVFTFNIEFYNHFGRKLKISCLIPPIKQCNLIYKDYIQASTKFVQTVILSDQSNCNSPNCVKLSTQSYRLTKINSDAIPFSIRVTPINNNNNSDSEFENIPHCDPYEHHKVKIDVSIILFSNIKVFELKKCCCK